MAGLGDGWRPASMRFNNPGAMNYGPFASRRGAKQAGRFAQFDTPEAGWAAMDDLLGSYRQRGLNTPSSVIGRWAPRNVDNNSTDQYTATVARRLGIGPNDPIPDSAWPQMAEVMASYEAGRPNPRPGARAPAAPFGAPFGGAPPGVLPPPMGLGGPPPAAEAPPAMPPMGAFMPPLPAQAGAAPPAAAPAMPPMSDFMPPLPNPPPAAPEGPASMPPMAGGADRFRSGTDLASNFMPAPTLPPAPPMTPFGPPEVQREPQLDALGSPFGASERQQPGIGLTAGINQATGGPPQPDADAIMRGAQGAADARTPQQRPFSINDLASNPLFMAGLSILGTAPGGNWGPNGAQAMAAATRGQREQTEFQRLQQQRATMDRVWAEAFPGGQPSAQHPLLQGMPPEMASTIFAMGPEEGLPLAQRWQMFRGQQSEQLRTMQARADIAEGRPSPQAPQPPPVGAGLVGATGLLPTGDQLEGMAASQPGPQAPASTSRPAANEPTVSFAGETMTLGQAQARARRLDALGMRSELLEKTIADASKSSQPPEAIRTRGMLIDNAYRTIVPELQRYASLVQSSGWTFGNNAERDAVQQARTNLTLQIKELYQLGALQQPDIEIINRLLLDTDPGYLNNNPVTGQNPASRVGGAMQRLEVKLRELRNNAVRPLGMPPIDAPGGRGGSGAANDPLGIR